MSIEKRCELSLRIPFDSKANAEIISEVLNVDLNKHDTLSNQEVSIKDDALCLHITSSRPKYLRSGSSAFFESFILCDEIIKEFAIPNKPDA